MKTDIDINAYSAKIPPRIKPEKVNLGELPPIQKPKTEPKDQGEVTDLQSSEVTKSVSHKVPNSVTNRHPKLQSYRLPNFKQLARIEARFTRDQKRFLDDLEDDIRYAKPEGEREDPENRRITKAAILRAFVELFRQMELELEPEKYLNENDLVEDLLIKLRAKVTELQTSELPK